MFEYTERREYMVEEQIAARSVTDGRVLNAMRQVPRHCFVPRAYEDQAYDDRPLPIGRGQTISQPFMVAYMTALLAPAPGERILEIGTGSGYQTAVLSLLAGRIVTIERDRALHDRARACLERLGHTNITFVCADGTQGYPEGSPYDGILVTAGGPELPPPLVNQLADGGRLICPVGSRSHQQIQCLSRQGSTLHTTVHTDCVFVPLTGKDGWPEDTD